MIVECEQRCIVKNFASPLPSQKRFRLMRTTALEHKPSFLNPAAVLSKLINVNSILKAKKTKTEEKTRKFKEARIAVQPKPTSDRGSKSKTRVNTLFATFNWGTRK